MKKLIFVLAIALIASPSFALTVALQRQGTSNLVDVVYSGADGNNLPRGIALDISSPTGTTIALTAGSYYQGESTSANPKYGIYPARIVIDSAGAVSNYGSPLADVNDPGAGADGTNHVVLEFGSLYVGDINAPATSGTLCTLTFGAGSVSNPTIVMVDEDTYRGGLVFEDGALGEVDTSLVFTTAIIVGAPTNPVPANAAVDVNLTVDLSWTAGANATSRDVYFGTVTPPPLVSSGQTATTYDTGTMVGNKTYYWKVVEKAGTDSNSGPIWSFTTNRLYVGQAFTCGNGGTLGPIVNLTITQVMVDKWIGLSKPLCWTCSGQKCGNGGYGGASLNRIDTVDLGSLKSSWFKTNTQVGYIPCVDFNLSGRVDTVDLGNLKAHWFKSISGTGCL